MNEKQKNLIYEDLLKVLISPNFKGQNKTNAGVQLFKYMHETL